MDKESAPRPTSPWWIDLAIAVALFVVFAAFRPMMPDGDGQGHAERGIFCSFLEGMSPKHLLYAPLLHGVYVALDAAGLGFQAIAAFTFVSNLAGALIYLVLARAVFPRIVPSVGYSQFAALGTALSYGVMSRSCAIETYALALLADVVLVAICLNCDLSKWRGGVSAGLAFAFAVGIHSTNVLTLPFVLVMLYQHARRSSLLSAGWFAATVATCALLMAAGTLVGQDASLWPPDVRKLIPEPDGEPKMPIVERLQRAAYGVARTFAWLPPKSELTRTYAIVYAIGFLLAGLLIAYVGCNGLWQERRRYRAVWLLMALLAFPFVVLGVYYYPSDPERWLFLMPLFWLVVALALSEYRPGRLSPALAFRLLSLAIFAMAVTNVVFILAPEARENRELTGYRALQAEGKAGDLVIAPGGKSKVIAKYILGAEQPFEMLGVSDVMRYRHPSDVLAGQKYLRERIAAALQEKRRVLVLALIDENLQPAQGYPWSYVANAGYFPETILSVLREFDPAPLVPTTLASEGLYVLRGRHD